MTPFDFSDTEVIGADEALVGIVMGSASDWPTMQHTARTLEQLDGRVIVIGHTDDQPLRSLRFKDNYELSTARARAVADLLAASLGGTGRIDVVGAGASQPLATPATLPQNRARNRRVEILYQPGD